MFTAKIQAVLTFLEIAVADCTHVFVLLAVCVFVVVVLCYWELFYLLFGEAWGLAAFSGAAGE